MSRMRKEGLVILALSLALVPVSLFVGCQHADHRSADVTIDQSIPSATRPALATQPGTTATRNRTVAGMTQHTFAGAGLDFDPDVDSAGRELVFASTRDSEHPDIYIKHELSGTATRLTSNPADDIQPRFSPDGTRVVFCSNRGDNWDLWLVNRDGTGLRRLTHDVGDEVAPCWAADASKIAFAKWTRQTRRWEVWTLDVEQPGVRRFLACGMNPDWSPDGSRLAFQRARRPGSRWFSIWTMPVAEGAESDPTELAQSPTAACIAPRWSPDGSQIVYCVVSPPVATGVTDSRQMVTELWVADAETGATSQLGIGGHPGFNPTWARTGRVYFVSTQAGREHVWSVQAGDSRRLLSDAGGVAPHLRGNRRQYSIETASD